MTLGESAPPSGRAFDIHELWRLGLWGTAAAGALLIAVSAGSTDSGAERLAATVAQLQGKAKSQAPQQVARPTDDWDGRRLAETVRMLAADRERLLARIGKLESAIDDATGSIARATPVGPPVSALPPEQPPISAEPIAPLPAIATAVPVPRPAPATPPDAAAKPEIGIDIGSAATLDGIRALWTTAKTRHGTLLDGLRPLIGARDPSRSAGPELYLIVGPLANAAAAARLCAVLTANGALCQPAPYEGQRLALR